MEDVSIIKLYIPHSIFISEAGYLMGRIHNNNICITGICNSTSDSVLKNTRSTNSTPDIPQSQVIGSWNKQCNHTKMLLTRERWVHITNKDKYSPECIIYNRVDDSVNCADIVTVYNSTPFLQSAILESRGGTNAGFVVNCVKCQRSELVAPVRSAKLTALVWMVCNMILMFIEQSFLSSRHIARIVHFLSGYSCCVHQARIRFGHWKTTCLQYSSSPLDKLRFENNICRQLIDILLGTFIMMWVYNTQQTDHWANVIMSYADTVVDQLNILLEWLMGVPAGLKLNSQLDQLLGNFFLYHIYLWTAYLNVLRGLLPDILWYITKVGCLGLSVQLCLLQDLFTTMTLHIYCFYVYAARIYSLQIYALSALWRLFRGKKWNVLRQRVDSALYDVDQLFLGTLLFTILLFLLPTTALYYAVFMLLRLMVLLLQWTILNIVAFMDGFHVYPYLLQLIKSPVLAGNISIMPFSGGISDKSLFLAMKVDQVSFSKINKLFKYSDLTDVKYTWKQFGLKMLNGELLYPWIEKNQDSNCKQ